MNIPEYLYHYTSIDTLDLILTNKNIRFNSLPYVDDKEEKKTYDMGDFGRYCFISSWTDFALENNDLWKRYGFGGKGVRIKLHSFPFKKYYIIVNDMQGIELIPSFLKREELYSNGYCIAFDKTSISKMLFKVEYSNDKHKLYPKLKWQNKHNTIINFEDVGKYKKDTWSVQNEWRYRIMIFPIDYKKISWNNPLAIADRLKAGIHLPFTDYYLSLDDKSLNDLEILLGPCTTTNDLDRVTEITKRNKIECKINRSKLI